MPPVYGLSSVLFCSVNSISPKYITNLIKIKSSIYDFREEKKADVPRVNTTRNGLRSSGSEAVRVWSSLPNGVHLSESYPQFRRMIRALDVLGCECPLCSALFQQILFALLFHAFACLIACSFKLHVLCLSDIARCSLPRSIFHNLTWNFQHFTNFLEKTSHWYKLNIFNGHPATLFQLLLMTSGFLENVDIYLFSQAVLRYCMIYVGSSPKKDFDF